MSRSTAEKASDDARIDHRHRTDPGPVAPVVTLQRRVGNRGFTTLVQRHAVGAALPDQAALVGQVRSATTASAHAPKPVAAGGGRPGPTAAEATTTPGAQAGGPTQVQPPSATEAERTAATTAGTGYSAELTTAGHGRAMSLAGAQTILQGAFGDIHTIVPGAIQILADRAAVWAKYDEVCIAAHITNPDTGVAWAVGDAQVASPGLEGFAWEAIVYVNADTPLVTATAHEMLHNNTAAGFRAGVGEAVNEGCTEYLAKKALGAAGVATPAGATAYPEQVAIVTALVGFVGEAALVGAYFGGLAGLVTAYERARHEPGSWSTLTAAADSLDLAQVTPLLTRANHPGETDLPAVGAGTAVA